MVRDSVLVEELIGIVDAGQLHEVRWPLVRLLARRYVEDLEMGGYVRRLLASHRWAMVRLVPHTTEQGEPSTHVFDVYGTPTGSITS